MNPSTPDILQNILPHFSFVIERKCTPEWVIPEGVFPEHNFLLVYEGEGFFHCNGRDFTATRGDLVYYKPGDMRWASTSKFNLMKCFVVNFSYTCPILVNEQWSLVDIPLPFDKIEKIGEGYLFSRLLDLFDQFTRTWISSKENYVMTARATFLEILNLLLKWKNSRGVDFNNIRKVEKVINYMTAHYSTPLQLQELAQVAQVSPSYLILLFKEVTGKTPIEHLIHIRMNRAKDFLQEGHTVTETAEMLGFNDIYYFSRCFKKRVGLSPSQYKERL